MSLSTITHAAAAVLAGLLVWFFQDARLGADLADERLRSAQYHAQITAERAAANARVAKVGELIAGVYQGVLNDAIQKQTTLQAAADRAGRQRDSLRKQLSDAEQRIADAPAAAVREYAATANQLLGQCSSRYTEVAKLADGHAADAATCRAAWPVIPPHLPTAGPPS
ncbi:hypothetical protein [Alicycliphilus denitrificans]|uniref:hypothetical protein n=1 Tax=Alicycliphilus denitrificans TaxID=179636 RepID=UPI000C9F2945|nr:hypothetical protein [Alicycliphilus denitrificans]